MAWLKYFIKGNQNPTTIYLRFGHGRNIDLKKSTSLLINPKYWSKSKGTVKNIAEFQDKRNLQNKLNSLEATILNSFNDAYSNGSTIDGEWLNNCVQKQFNQSESSDLNTFIGYAEHFYDNLDNKIQGNGVTGVKPSTKRKYRTVINKVKQYENHKNVRLLLMDINLKFHKDFINFLHENQKLNLNTTGKYLVFIKTICKDAKKHGYKINSDIENGEFKPTKEDVKFITLNEDEINTIFNFDFSDRPYLDNAKNWLIIGVWTGARVSDLLSLTDKNITDGFIEYTSQKTNQKIILPIHPQIKSTLVKLEGQFPRKISSQKFNNYIKVICKSVGLFDKVTGSLNCEISPGVWRKVKGDYLKYELVSSHICRRSFATNLYGKLPTPVIMSITGHTTEKMFLNYIGKTAKDNAKVLKEYWESMN